MKNIIGNILAKINTLGINNYYDTVITNQQSFSNLFEKVNNTTIRIKPNKSTVQIKNGTYDIRTLMTDLNLTVTNTSTDMCIIDLTGSNCDIFEGQSPSKIILNYDNVQGHIYYDTTSIANIHIFGKPTTNEGGGFKQSYVVNSKNTLTNCKVSNRGTAYDMIHYSYNCQDINNTLSINTGEHIYNFLSINATNCVQNSNYIYNIHIIDWDINAITNSNYIYTPIFENTVSSPVNVFVNCDTIIGAVNKSTITNMYNSCTNVADLSPNPISAYWGSEQWSQTFWFTASGSVDITYGHSLLSGITISPMSNTVRSISAVKLTNGGTSNSQWESIPASDVNATITLASGSYMLDITYPSGLTNGAIGITVSGTMIHDG